MHTELRCPKAAIMQQIDLKLNNTLLSLSFMTPYVRHNFVSVREAAFTIEWELSKKLMNNILLSLKNEIEQNNEVL